MATRRSAEDSKFVLEGDQVYIAGVQEFRGAPVGVQVLLLDLAANHVRVLIVPFDVIDRRREIGLLRFLGAAASQVRKQILVGAGLLGLLANFAGLALGLALSLILIYVINKQSFGWTIRFHWPVAVLLGAISVVYVATVLAALYPAQVAVRLNPLEAVHEE